MKQVRDNNGHRDGQWEEHRRRDGTVGLALRDKVGPLTVSTVRHEYYPEEEVYQTWILGIPVYRDNYHPDKLSTGKAEARKEHKKGIAHAKAYLAGEGRTIDKGTRVTIIGGRRGKGQSGSVFWTGKNKWGDGDRLGVSGDDGETYWVNDVDAVVTVFQVKENVGKYVRQGARFRPRVRDRFAEKREKKRKAEEEAEKREIKREGKVTLYEGQVWTGPGRSHWSTSLEPLGVRDEFTREIVVPLWLAELAEAAKGDTMAEIQFLKWLREEGYIERTR